MDVGEDDGDYDEDEGEKEEDGGKKSKPKTEVEDIKDNDSDGDV